MEWKWILTGFVALATTCAGRAATPTYSLSCETMRGQNFTLALTSFSFHVGGSTPNSAAGSAMGSARRSTSELIFRFAPSGVYEMLLTAVQSDEILKSCRLIETTTGASAPSGTHAGTDDWNQMMSVPKGSTPTRGSSGSTPAVGTMEWTLTNGMITGLTAIGGDGAGAGGTPTGAPSATIQGTIVAQSFTFTMR
jgi:hypothetical protein